MTHCPSPKQNKMQSHDFQRNILLKAISQSYHRKTKKKPYSITTECVVFTGCICLNHICFLFRIGNYSILYSTHCSALNGSQLIEMTFLTGLIGYQTGWLMDWFTDWNPDTTTDFHWLSSLIKTLWCKCQSPVIHSPPNTHTNRKDIC